MSKVAQVQTNRKCAWNHKRNGADRVGDKLINCVPLTVPLYGGREEVLGGGDT